MFVKIERQEQDNNVILEAELIHYSKYFNTKIGDLGLSGYSVYWAFDPNEVMDFVVLSVFKNRNNELGDIVLVPWPARVFVMNNDGKTIDSIYLDYRR